MNMCRLRSFFGLFMTIPFQFGGFTASQQHKCAQIMKYLIPQNPQSDFVRCLAVSEHEILTAPACAIESRWILLADPLFTGLKQPFI